MESTEVDLQTSISLDMTENGHVARRSKIDEIIKSSGNTPRSNSWSREHPEEQLARLTQSARSPRSKSMNRPKLQDHEEEEKEKRDNAEAAFREWLKRKAAEPRTPRASPSREAISRHLKDEARQRVINQWHNNKRFQKQLEAFVNQKSNNSSVNNTL